MPYLKPPLFRALQLAGLTAAVRDSAWRGRRLLVLCYHGVSLVDEHEASPELYMPSALLRRRLERLRAGGYAVLSLDEGVRRMYAGTLPSRSVALTFDDGTADFARRVTPLLREFDVPATVYLATYYSGRGQPIFDTALRYLLWRGRGTRADVSSLAKVSGPLALGSEAEREVAWAALYGRAAQERLDADAKDALLRELAERADVDYDDFLATGMFQVMSPAEVASLPADLVDVQLHTHRHRTPVDQTLFRRELTDNRRCIEQMTGGRSTTHFCYPSGNYRGEFLPWLRELGVASATTGVPGLAAPGMDPLTLPRFVDTTFVSDATFEAWLSGVADLLPRRRAYRLDPERLRTPAVSIPAVGAAPPAPTAVPPTPLTTPSSSSAAGSPSARTARAS